MSRIQLWFERMAGITQEEVARRKFAEELFGQQRFDVAMFQKPACWRRKSVSRLVVHNK